MDLPVLLRGRKSQGRGWHTVQAEAWPQLPVARQSQHGPAVVAEGQDGHTKQVGTVLSLQGDWHAVCVWVVPQQHLRRGCGCVEMHRRWDCAHTRGCVSHKGASGAAGHGSGACLQQRTPTLASMCGADALLMPARTPRSI